MTAIDATSYLPPSSTASLPSPHASLSESLEHAGQAPYQGSHILILVFWRRGLNVDLTSKCWDYKCVPPCSFPLAEFLSPQVPWTELLAMTRRHFYLLLDWCPQALPGVSDSVSVGTAV